MIKEKDIVQNYLNAISAKYAHEETSEMGYRTDFELLLKGVFESIKVTRFDHDARAKEGKKPDFVVVKNSVCQVPILVDRQIGNIRDGFHIV